MKREITTPAMRELYEIISNYNEEQRYKKASRHLQDALYLRSLRHDYDSKVISP